MRAKKNLLASSRWAGFLVSVASIAHFLLVAPIAHAQISLTGTSYSENFDGMGTNTPSSTTPFGWFVGRAGLGTNGAVNDTSVITTNGSLNIGTNYNFGVAGVNAITDRALGSIASFAGSNRVTEVRFTNNTGATITNLNISYDGEQWRDGAQAGTTNVLTMFFSTNGSNFTAMGAALTFPSPQDTITQSELDGNASSNRVAGISGNFATNIVNGGTFYLRWLDIKDQGVNDGLAIDNFNLTVTHIGVANSWTDGNGKWETGGNWSLGVAPTNVHTAIVITNAGSNTVTIDGVTPAESMTISNLTVSANLLQLTNAGVLPLHVLNQFALTNSASLLITNSIVQVDAGPMRFSNNSKITVLNAGTLDVGGNELQNHGGGLGNLTIAGGTAVMGGLAITGVGTGLVWVTQGGILDVGTGLIQVGTGYPGGSIGVLRITNGTVRAGTVLVSAGFSFIPCSISLVSGFVHVDTNLTIGNFGSGTGSVDVQGGGMLVTNSSQTAGLDLISGTFTINGGTVTADRLTMTNTSGTTFAFPTGVLESRATIVTNSSDFTVGNGVDPSWFRLNGGTHSFQKVLHIRNNATLSGCGTINGNSSIDSGGTVVADCGGSLNFLRTVTNNGTIFAVAGTTIKFSVLMVNNGLIDATNGVVQFNGGVVNNGTILTNSFPQNGTNSWIDSNGKWETGANWSLGVAPTNTHLAVRIANAGSNVVTIDSLTVTGSTGATSLTINNLTITSNTLALINAGVATPLQIVEGTTGLRVTSGGSLIISNSFLKIKSQTPFVDGSLLLDGGLLVQTNPPVGNTFYVGLTTPGQLTLANGLAVVESMRISSGTLTMGAATNLVNALFENFGATWINGGSLVCTGAASSVRSLGQTTVSNGTVRAKLLEVGYPYSGFSGSLTVNGGTMLVSSSLTVGNATNGLGFVTVAGGSVYVTNAAHTGLTDVRFGTFVLTGGLFRTDILLVTNSHGIFINNGGTFSVTGQSQVDSGTNTISSGTTVLSSNFLVGSSANSTGIVNVIGGSLVVTNGTLGIGNSGTVTSGSGVGSMNVSNATVTASTILLGSSAGGQGELTLGIGGTIISAGTNAVLICNNFGQIGGDLSWTNIGSAMYCGYAHPGAYALSNGTSSCQDMYVGYDDAGTMTIAGGAMNILSRLTVGHLGSPMSTGAVWMTGGQLTMLSLSAIIGNSGVGQMTLSNGSVTAATMIVGNGSNPGSLTVAGGMLTVLSSLTVGNCGSGMTGIVTIAGGNLFVTNAAHNATLDVRNRSVTLSSGLLKVDRLVMTNACALFVRSGGTLIYGQAVLDPNLDADGDGIPNGWEQSHGLDPLNAADANADNDGDGLSNLREYQLGTDPGEATSPYRITAIARESNNLRVTWTTVGGTTNFVQVSAGTVGGSYTNYFGDLSGQLIILGSTVTSTNYLDSNGATNSPSRYYRIRVVR